MARRASKQPKGASGRPSYHVVFGANPVMMQRIDSILAGDGDPHPNATSSRFLESCMKALAEGKPPPAVIGELIRPVEGALLEVFARRDQRVL